MARPTRALIDLAALAHNCALARSLAPGASTLAVVKSNAYGHGAPAVARALEGQVQAFGVACIEEALELREAGVRAPVLLMEGVFEPVEIDIAAQENFCIMVENARQLAWLDAARPAAPLGVWLKVDTGMGRLGFAPAAARAAYASLAANRAVAPGIVVATHLACADELDNEATARQLARLRIALGDIEAPLSIANSPALLGWPAARAQWNRLGYMLYGCSPFPAPHPLADGLRPVMTLVSEIVSLHELAPGEPAGYGAAWSASRPSRLATIPAGYTDGYPRSAANGTPVLVNGRVAPLAGRVSMDMLMVDVTDLPEARPGDPVQLWGPDIAVDTVAARSGTIGYELLVRIPPRVPRIYL